MMGSRLRIIIVLIIWHGQKKKRMNDRTLNIDDHMIWIMTRGPDPHLETVSRL